MARGRAPELKLNPQSALQSSLPGGSVGKGTLPVARFWMALGIVKPFSKLELLLGRKAPGLHLRSLHSVPGYVKQLCQASYVSNCMSMSLLSKIAITIPPASFAHFC